MLRSKACSCQNVKKQRHDPPHPPTSGCQGRDSGCQEMWHARRGVTCRPIPCFRRSLQGRQWLEGGPRASPPRPTANEGKTSTTRSGRWSIAYTRCAVGCRAQSPPASQQLGWEQARDGCRRIHGMECCVPRLGRLLVAPVAACDVACAVMRTRACTVRSQKNRQSTPSHPQRHIEA